MTNKTLYILSFLSLALAPTLAWAQGSAAGPGTTPPSTQAIGGALVMKGSTNFYVGPNTTVTTTEIDNGITANIENHGTIQCSGTWKNNGTMTERTGIVILDGGGDGCLQGTTKFNDLTIDKDFSTLHVDINATLGGPQHITGNLTLRSGKFDVSNDSLVLLSDNLGTARIAEVEANGSLTGTFTMQRYIDGDDGWRLLSAPVEGAQLSDWEAEILMSCIDGHSVHTAPHWTSVFRYDETILDSDPQVGWTVDPTLQSLPHTGTVGYTEVLDPGTGYLVYTASGAGTITVRPDLTGGLTSGVNRGTVTINTTHTVTPPGGHADGWNLIGNPYPSQINWDDITLSNISAIGYKLNPSTGLFDDIDGGDGSETVIPSHQAFWVYNPSLSGSAVFNEENKTTSTTSFYKNLPDSGIVFTLTGYGNENQARIRFRDNATVNYDFDLDAFSLTGYDPVTPALFTLTADSMKMMANSLPEDYDTFSVPMGFHWNGYLPSVQEYFMAIRVDRLPPEVSHICLQDLATGAAVTLEEGDGYTFMTNWSASPVNRFLVSGPMVGCATAVEGQSIPEEQIEVTQKDGTLHIDFALDNPSESMIRITNLLGQVVYTQTTNMQHGTLVVPEPSALVGAYLVTIYNPGISVHKKLLKGM